MEAFARERKYQHLIIESTGISDPNPVAEALAISDYNGDYINDGDFDGSADHAVGDKVIRATAADGRDGGLASTEGTGEGLFSLDTLVTVVDATSFLDEVRKADDLEDRGLEAQEGDTRTIADLLVSQAGALCVHLCQFWQPQQLQCGVFSHCYRRAHGISHMHVGILWILWS